MQDNATLLVFVVVVVSWLWVWVIVIDVITGGWVLSITTRTVTCHATYCITAKCFYRQKITQKHKTNCWIIMTTDDCEEHAAMVSWSPCQICYFYIKWFKHEDSMHEKMSGVVICHGIYRPASTHNATNFCSRTSKNFFTVKKTHKSFPGFQLMWCSASRNSDFWNACSDQPLYNCAKLSKAYCQLKPYQCTVINFN